MLTVNPGLAGVVAFDTEIAEPDRDGGALRYHGIDVDKLAGRASFGDVWGLLVDARFGHGLPPAEPFPLPIHSGDVRVDVQAGLAMLAPIWGYPPLLDIDDATARDQLARASVMALSYVAQSFGMNEGSANPGGIPARYILKSLIPIGFALFFLQSLAQGIRGYLAWRGPHAV